VDVITVGVDAADVGAIFTDHSRNGMAPDLLLADTGVVHDLAQAGLIQDLGRRNDVDTTRYLATALAMVADGDHLYGLPFAGHTQVLFFNHAHVASPPEDIFALVARADRGEIVALPTGFEQSYWGIGAYDGAILDADRRLALGLGGFANWLEALQVARTMPGFLLSEDANVLRQAFVDGDVTYYVGNSTELLDLETAMGKDKVGVAALPAGPSGSAARPLLFSDAFVFGSTSSPAETVLALDLAQALTGAQAQFDLAQQDIGRLPATNQVRLTPNLPARALVVARQGRLAVGIAWADRTLWQELTADSLGFVDAYRQVVAGNRAPGVMVAWAQGELSARWGLDTVPPDSLELCPTTSSAIRLRHVFQNDEAVAFAAIVRRFEATCPGVEVTTTGLPAADIFERYVSAAAGGNEPDLIFASSRWLPQLATQGLLQDISELVSPQQLQQFQPRAVQAMRYDGRLYGIPESLSLLALFYNTALVSDSPIDLEQLQHDVDAGQRWALPVDFRQGYWGLAAFGGFEFDSHSGQISAAAGLVAWLSWLQAADKQPGMDLLLDGEQGEQAFARGEAAYFVGDPAALSALRQALGDDGFRVTPLPNGQEGVGSPILEAVGSMISARAGAAETATALAFARFLALPESQRLLVETGDHVPASIQVNLAAYPHSNGFREQAKTAAQVVENAAFARLLALGDDLYRAVLQEGVDPAAAVATFVTAVNAANGAE
jgi:arabinogalactan oligomer/maltooligosaccharide transport system substrate-binding protein